MGRQIHHHTQTSGLYRVELAGVQLGHVLRRAVPGGRGTFGGPVYVWQVLDLDRAPLKALDGGMLYEHRRGDASDHLVRLVGVGGGQLGLGDNLLHAEQV